MTGAALAAGPRLQMHTEPTADRQAVAQWREFARIRFDAAAIRDTFLIDPTATQQAKDDPMTLKTALAALALTLVPAMGFAMGCSERSHQAQSCADGTVWDDALKTCVKQVTG